VAVIRALRPSTLCCDERVDGASGLPTKNMLRQYINEDFAPQHCSRADHPAKSRGFVNANAILVWRLGVRSSAVSVI